MSEQIREAAEHSKDYMKGRFLTFLIGNETFGVEIGHVMEIIGIQPITTMPESPDFIKGVINLRGMIIPVLDVRVRFQKEAKEYNERTCIIVVKLNSESIGLIVDSVSEVRSIPEEEIVRKPDFGMKEQKGYIKGIGKVGEKVILLIDCEKMLSESELSLVSAIL